MIEQELWEKLLVLIEARDQEQLQFWLRTLQAQEVAYALSHLSDDARAHLLDLLSPEDAAHLLEQLSDVQAADIIENIQPSVVAAILDELPNSDQADILAELETENAEAILQEMNPTDAQVVRQLATYQPTQAGGLMTTSFLSYRDSLVVREVVEDLRAKADLYRDYEVQYAYVVNSEDHLVGVLRLRDLLLGQGSIPVRELMLKNPLSISVDSDLDTMVDFFDTHHYLGVPVTDHERRIVGVVQKAAVDEAWEERQDRTYLKRQGIVYEELRSMPTIRRSGGRLSWLSINIVLNMCAASVIAVFQDTLSAVIALAVFLPIISDMSGCSGNQAVAVSLRELSLGLIRPHEIMRVWFKEISVGLINGICLGILIALVAFIWKGNPYLGLVVGVALWLNTMVAVSIGGAIPLILKRFGMDPALAAGPILTTVTDMCGFFFVLGFATIAMPWIQ
ncbi:MAG: magnesium transporter [Zavarzinella sp.]